MRYLVLSIIFLMTFFTVQSQDVETPGLTFRCVGPALTSGRIIDIAVNPDNPHEYYAAAASGGVWKTINNGTTFTPIFDGEASYSIGCVTIDPSNHNTVWVGSGENNNQRSVAYGDGIYKSTDGGQSWTNMGLKTSEHIAKIIVHPDNSDYVVVAAMGPLWSAGGERGVYVTQDGGKTWTATLTVDQHTGASDLVIDPRDPNVMYASTQQRRRQVFTYVGGGKESSVYKSTDAGMTWAKVEKGLPATLMGRVGLAISPANPDYVYAIVEAANGKGGTYRTTNGGTTWEKRGGYATSGNYYQELVCDPHDPDLLYSMNTWLNVSEDGGKTFRMVGEEYKHVDNHCMWIDPSNTDRWIVGCDGGIYDTYDGGKTWVYKPNLPITQFYKVSVDNDEPFYNIYGGTQDNNSMYGPSRVANSHGIRNSDWTLTHGGDGFESVADPQNPDIVYAQSQYGVLVRYDRKNGEEVGIQPKERKGEDGYRWNWDSPLIASPHKSGRIYFAANKVFRSDNYGNSWEVISEDLTRQINRNTLPVMGRVQSIDAVMKNMSTSLYGTIVAMDESKIDPDLLVVGTDDGLIHITTDGGDNWQKVSRVSGAPDNSYINTVVCSQHDENVVYAAFNHHKFGDFKPYLYVSRDKGKTWRSISADLPERGSVYALAEDHVDKDLLFCGTEFGVHYTTDGGSSWTALKSGLPTIAVRDIDIQERESDLVLGTFGRGFYVLDDYSPLRSVKALAESKSSKVLPIRKALSFELAKPLGNRRQGSQGHSFYSADNLGSVAMINYYVADEVKTLKDKRQEDEKEKVKNNEDTPFPSYDALKAERDQASPYLLFVIEDAKGDMVAKLKQPYKTGVQRTDWDLRYPSKDPIKLKKAKWVSPYASRSCGPLVPSGTYSVTMHSVIDGKMVQLGDPVKFDVESLDDAALPVADEADKLAFQKELAELNRSISGAQKLVGEINTKLDHMEAAALATNLDYSFMEQLLAAKDQLKEADVLLNGDPIKTKLDIDQPPSPASRVGWIRYEQRHSSAPVTTTHRSSLAIAKEEFKPILDMLTMVADKLVPALETALEKADAPYTPGRAIEMMRGQ